jgi:hypothetical protein
MSSHDNCGNQACVLCVSLSPLKCRSYLLCFTDFDTVFNGIFAVIQQFTSIPGLYIHLQHVYIEKHGRNSNELFTLFCKRYHYSINVVSNIFFVCLLWLGEMLCGVDSTFYNVPTTSVEIVYRHCFFLLEINAYL